MYIHILKIMKKIFKKPRQNQAKKIADICIWMSDPVKFNEMQDGFIKKKEHIYTSWSAQNVVV